MITIGVDNVCDGTALIIQYPSGILYEAQCGGLLCDHRMIEGFTINLNTFADDFDDCSYGCCHLPELPESQKRLAEDLSIYFDKNPANRLLKIEFDYDRIPELTEGWWPVKVSGTLDVWNKLEGDFKGIIHTGNCD